MPSITLAATDLTLVKRGTIEEGVAVTGDLRPIETVEIRARIEGDLVAVNVREGEQVKAGQVLARFEDSEQSSGYASAKADKLAAESDFTTAQWNLEQTGELFKAGAIAERDYKLAQQSVATATARLAAADARVRANGSLMSDTRATAPTTGVISKRAVENGEHIARGASMFTLVRTNILELAAAVPARFASAVKVGQTVSFGADGRTFDGKVARVSPTVDPTTRSVTVFVQIPNPNDALKGGTFATGRVVSRSISKVLIIPIAAVRLTADGQSYVYRLNGKAVDVANVQLGTVDERGGVAEVLTGLSEGDRIIVGNVGTLGRGMQVIIAGEEAPAGRPGQGKQATP
jgi:RND family efflux transporter MFP subunit